MMNKKVLSAAILFSIGAASMAATSANAAQINFNGTVTDQTCELSSVGDLNFDLSAVGVSDVKDAGQQVGMMSLAAAVTCDGADKSGTVTMSLQPSNPGAVNGNVLKNTAAADAAKGVGFVVMNEKNELLDFTSGLAEIHAPMSADGSATIVISANYAKDGSGDTVEPGAVQAVLPFVLTYQ